MIYRILKEKVLNLLFFACLTNVLKADIIKEEKGNRFKGGSSYEVKLKIAVPFGQLRNGYFFMFFISSISAIISNKATIISIISIKSPP